MAALSQHKLTPDDVRAIRLAYSNDGVSMSALGREYGVSTQAVSDVVHRRSFANVRDRDPKPPTPEQIREACESIRETWTPEVRARRLRPDWRSVPAVIPGSHWGPVAKGETY